MSFYVIAAVDWHLSHWENIIAYCGGFVYIGHITYTGQVTGLAYHLQSFHYSIYDFHILQHADAL